jgi:hypothetical protein
MSTITIIPENPGSPTSAYRAISGAKQSTGKTAGEALDALTAQLDESDGATLVVLQPMQPDRFFTAEQQERLGELMNRWRQARDAGQSLPAEEQLELHSLIEAELRATAARARHLIQGLSS